MDYLSTIDDDDLINTAHLLRLVNRPSFTTSNAIFSVSCNWSKSTAIDCIKTVDTALFSLRTGPPLILSIEEQCYLILQLAKKLPNLTPKKEKDGVIRKKDMSRITFNDFRSPKLTDVLRLLDLPAAYLVSSQKYYRNIDRYIKKQHSIDDGKKLYTTKTTATKIVCPPAPVSTAPVSIVRQPSSLFATAISPLSMSQQSSKPVQLIEESESDSEIESTLHVPTVSISRLSSSSTNLSDFLKVSSLPKTRKSSKQAQDDRTRSLAYRNTLSSAYKTGSKILKDSLDGRVPLQKFDGKTAKEIALNVACAVNEMYGFDLLCGNEIHKCVKDERVGQSPPRRGAKTRLPSDEEEAIATVVYTALSLQQVNCDPNTLNRPQMRQLIMKIINAALEKRGKDPLNEVKYYERIQQMLSSDVTVTTTNKRDALRTAWCTYEKQKQDYITFEQAVVDLELGRWSQTKEERREFGNIVLYPGQEYRIMNFDEMGFSYDGCKNGLRGRKAMYHTNKHLPQPGQATNKSAQKNSLICGMNFAFEALPPGIILQSSAVAPRIRVQLLKHMKHVRGQFGHSSVEDPNDVKTFPVFISWSKDSSVTDQIFIQYILHLKTFCYPDAKDVPGYRVLMKADSGPGRMNKEFLAIARSHGFYFLPGLPNGTELGQEMDQVFAEFKGILEENRDLLYKTLFSLPVDEN